MIVRFADPLEQMLKAVFAVLADRTVAQHVQQTVDHDRLTWPAADFAVLGHRLLGEQMIKFVGLKVGDVFVFVRSKLAAVLCVIG